MQLAQCDRVGASRTQASTISWRKCLDLYECLTIAPDLTGVYYPIPYLQIFVDLIRVGTLDANRSGAKKHTMEGYLRDMAQIFSGREA